MNKKLILFIGMGALAALFFAAGWHRYFSFEQIKAHQVELRQLVAERPVFASLAYLLTYIAVAALSLPGALVLTLIAGALFGLPWGTVLASFASSIGALLAFWAARYLLREPVQRRFARFLEPINRGIDKDGAFYLFTLRLVPAFPFFVVNLLMGLTHLPSRTFYWVSQLGMLAGTLVYVNAGRQLAELDSPADILRPGLVVSFILLGLFPLIAKKIVDALRARRVYQRWQSAKPAKFDRNVVVIGAGSAGLVSALIAATVKAKVSLVERHRMGGDCLNTGCVPSKALIKTAKLLAQAADSRRYGIASMHVEFDFAEVMERVAGAIKTIEPHDSVERYTSLGVDCVAGSAKIVSPWSVQVTTAEGQKTLTTRSIVIAAGASPLMPPIPGLELVEPLTSENLWRLRRKPERLLVLGGGPIGCELAQAFARLGCKVTQVEMADRLMTREDEEISTLVAERFRAEGIDLRLGQRATRFELDGARKRLIVAPASGQGQETAIEFDQVLVALGRSPNTAGLGLEELGIATTKSRTVEVNEFLQTSYPNIYACGDVAGPYQFTHTASHQAWYATVNALFGRFKKFRADYSVIPWATFVDPEVARVGLNELEAKQRNIAYELTRFGLDRSDRAIADSTTDGFVKVLTVPGKDRILGVTIVGEHAGDLITEFISAMKNGFGLNRILGTIHIYPTLAEVNRLTAGAWKRERKPQWALRLAERLHDRARG